MQQKTTRGQGDKSSRNQAFVILLTQMKSHFALRACVCEQGGCCMLDSCVCVWVFEGVSGLLHSTLGRLPNACHPACQPSSRLSFSYRKHVGGKWGTQEEDEIQTNKKKNGLKAASPLKDVQGHATTIPPSQHQFTANRAQWSFRGQTRTKVQGHLRLWGGKTKSNCQETIHKQWWARYLNSGQNLSTSIATPETMEISEPSLERALSSSLATRLPETTRDTLHDKSMTTLTPTKSWDFLSKTALPCPSTDFLKN